MSRSVQKTTNFDVVIVGGGLSGLTAAWELKKRDKNLRITVLEAKDRLGGRTLTKTLKTAVGEDVWDFGGQWISRSHKHMLQIVSELQLETYTQFKEGTKLIQLSGDTVKSYSTDIPNLSLLTLLDMEQSIRKLEKIAKTFSVEDPSSHPDVDYYDTITVETLLQKHAWTERALRVLRMPVETMYGVSPGQLSAFSFLGGVCATDGLKKMIEAGEGGAQELKIKGGTQQISILLSQKIGLENVHLSVPVTAVKQVGDEMQVFTKDGKVFGAKRVLMAIPVHLNVDIEYDPPLPTRKHFLFKNMQMGNLLKMIIVYETAFWRDRGFSGEVINEGKQGDYYEPIDVVFDASTTSGSPALVAFMSAKRSIFWGEAKPEERKQAVLKCLFKFFGEEALTPVSYEEKNWCLEPYNGGCPTNLCAPGLADFYSLLRVPHGSVHWGSTETSYEWTGYMEGAVSAGKQAALQVLMNLKPDLLTQEEKSLQAKLLQPRKSKVIGRKHKVFRYALGFGLLAVSIVILKKTYFRIAL